MYLQQNNTAKNSSIQTPETSSVFKTSTPLPKDVNETQILDQLYQASQVKTKAKWKPKETHHNIVHCIDLVQQDMKKIK